MVGFVLPLEHLERGELLVLLCNETRPLHRNPHKRQMKQLKDAKSWAIAFVESAGIFAFNAVFVRSLYSVLGEHVSAESVVIVSGVLFLLRMVWFYLNLRFRLFLEKR